jgi:signal transduction histidine kinase/CheY-like chemotaxis protein
MAKVLVADDKASNREFISTLLGYAGHEVLEAEDGAEALEKARASHPELVIADVLMPVMDGFEFVRQLRNDPTIAKTPVLFYTASYHEREARALASSCGVYDVLIKPTEPQRILEVVSQALGMEQAVATMPGSEFDREHMRLLTDKLSSSNVALEATNQRLADLLEISGVLAAENDSAQLLAKFCPAAREIIGARFAFLAVLSENNTAMQPILISGLDPESATAISKVDATTGILSRLHEVGIARLRDVKTDALVAGLPVPQSGIRAFMGTELTTHFGPYALFWVLEKVGGGEFREEDERVLLSLSAQFSIAYENALRYAQVQEHAAQLERRVAERTAELRDANQELEAFNYTVAHDLRAPLRNIKGYLQLLIEDHVQEISGPARQYINSIQTGAMRMGNLLDDLLSLSQVGRKELKRERMSLDGVVAEVLSELERDTKGRNIDWKIASVPNIEGDPVLIKQVFVNLLSNAVKYTRRRPHTTIELGTVQKDGETVFFVRDNGVGFDMKDAGKLFGVFKRLHGADEFEGTGAGLAIVQRILHKHGGRIWPESTPEKGATFYFTIGPSRR